MAIYYTNGKLADGMKVDMPIFQVYLYGHKRMSDNIHRTTISIAACNVDDIYQHIPILMDLTPIIEAEQVFIQLPLVFDS